MKPDYKDIAIRALKTGIQAFAAVIAGAPALDLDMIQGAAISGLAVFMSVMNNMVLAAFKKPEPAAAEGE